MSNQHVRVIQSQPVLLIDQRPLVQCDGHIRVISLQPDRHAQRIRELPAAGITTFGRFGQRPLQDIVHGWRQAGPPLRQSRRRRRQVRVQHRHAFIPGKWRLAGQQHERRTRQRVLIRARVDLLPLDLLGRAVNRRPQEVTCSGLADRRQRTFRQPEIRQINMIGPTGPRIYEHIGRFDITVHQPGGMSGIEGRSHPGDNRRGPRHGQRAYPVHERAHITARHVSHCDEQNPVRVARFEYGDDVRIIHGRRRPGFTNETVPERLVRRHRRREDLERDLPFKPPILGSEHDRHAASADLLLQPVSGDPRTDGEAGQEPGGFRSLVAHHTSRTRKPSSASSALCRFGPLPSGMTGADSPDGLPRHRRVSAHPSRHRRAQAGQPAASGPSEQPPGPRRLPVPDGRMTSQPAIGVLDKPNEGIQMNNVGHRLPLRVTHHRDPAQTALPQLLCRRPTPRPSMTAKS